MLKKPPSKYSFIEDEDWNIFVKDRLSNAFQVKLLKHVASINMIIIIFINCLGEMYALIFIYKCRKLGKFIRREGRNTYTIIV